MRESVASRLPCYARPMRYDIHSDVKFGPLEVVDAGKLADDCAEPWWNQSLCLVNDSVARIGVFCGEFHWHKHDREDELFFVLDGELLLDVRDPDERTVKLAPRQGMVVPKGIVHRTRAPARTVVLMVEAATVIPTGD
jgi:mannose-6-phosphate isomerase-like protein (cupin superfamily)